MRQFRAELRRFASRRLTRVLVLFSVALLVLVGFIVFTQTDDAAQFRVAIERERAEQLDACVRFGGGSDLQIGPGGKVLPPTTVDPSSLSPEEFERSAADCGLDYGMTVDEAVAQRLFAFTKLWPVPEDGPSETMTYLDEEGVERELPEQESGEVGWLAIPGLLLFLGALVVGASMIGADWQTGVFPTLLTWETRRVRLFVIKLVAAFVLAVAVAAFLLVVFSAVLFPTAAVKGTTAGMTGEWWQGVALALARTSLVAGLGALIGMGIAMLGRRTALAIGLLAAYLLVLENLVRGFRPQWQGWLLGNAITVAISAQKQRYWYGDDQSIVLYPGRAFTVLGLYALVAIVTAAFAFARRDISAS